MNLGTVFICQRREGEKPASAAHVRQLEKTVENLLLAAYRVIRTAEGK